LRELRRIVFHSNIARSFLFGVLRVVFVQVLSPVRRQNGILQDVLPARLLKYEIDRLDMRQFSLLDSLEMTMLRGR
jgi:hypothetical protein